MVGVSDSPRSVTVSLKWAACAGAAAPPRCHSAPEWTGMQLAPPPSQAAASAAAKGRAAAAAAKGRAAAGAEWAAHQLRIDAGERAPAGAGAHHHVWPHVQRLEAIVQHDAHAVRPPHGARPHRLDMHLRAPATPFSSRHRRITTLRLSAHVPAQKHLPKQVRRGPSHPAWWVKVGARVGPHSHARRRRARRCPAPG